ncbi:GntR family transcriptional regulator [Pararhodobacter oceanensis]|uniref:Transcriptional regulator n=1 Tax=Pararhodobacter oceanensis TaxID=2172121 RepID=A0A2T8HXF2_9RHOB|nr:FCD domain-containing protein [Pararhodobacter oceanensis]PVH30109.1 transcriptional regulator [Pararhodobacter oceanensis]
MPEIALNLTSAYERLRHEILQGDLQSGERLRVADLHARYGFGLTPIREALMRLTSEGLVVTEANRGARVRAVTLEELHDLMQTRREIEALCLRASMANGGAEWEAQVLSTMHLLARADLPQSPGDSATAAIWERKHRDFHHALISACGSPWLLRIWDDLADHSERYRKLRLLNYRALSADVRDLNADHRAIMDAVINRDADRAVRLMDLHLHNTESAVARLLHDQLTTGDTR